MLWKNINPEDLIPDLVGVVRSYKGEPRKDMFSELLITGAGVKWYRG